MAKITMLVRIAIQFGVVLAAVETENASGVWSVRLVLSALAPVFAARILSSRLHRVAFRPRRQRGLPSGFWGTPCCPRLPARAPLLARPASAHTGGVLVGAFVGALAVDVAAAVVLVAFYRACGAVVANIVGQVISIVILARRELPVQGTRIKDWAAICARGCWALDRWRLASRRGCSSRPQSRSWRQ